MRRALLSVFLLLAALATPAAPAQTVEFIHLSDTHLITASALGPGSGGQRLLLAGAAPLLEGYLLSLRARPPAFLIHTGDVIDGFAFETSPGTLTVGQVELARDTLGASPVPVYAALGNHDVTTYRRSRDGKSLARDLSAQAKARAAWRRALPCFGQGTYYSFRRNAGPASYLFLILDNSDPGDAAYAAAQIKWLAGQLKDPRASAVIVALHIPPGDDPVSRALLSALTAARRPALILCGHRHSDAVEDLRSGGLVVRTSSFLMPPVSTRRIVLHPDRIEVCETGAPDRIQRTIPVPQRAAISNHGASAAR